MEEDQLANQIKAYAELAKTDKKVDVASLALSALQAHEVNLLTPREKRWAYLTSIGVPPFGLIFALKFYVSGKDDGKTAAYMCVGLTFFAFFLFWLMFKLMLGGSGVTPTQIQQIKPSDVNQYLQ